MHFDATCLPASTRGLTTQKVQRAAVVPNRGAGPRNSGQRPTRKDGEITASHELNAGDACRRLTPQPRRTAGKYRGSVILTCASVTLCSGQIAAPLNAVVLGGSKPPNELVQGRLIQKMPTRKLLSGCIGSTAKMAAMADDRMLRLAHCQMIRGLRRERH